MPTPAEVDALMRANGGLVRRIAKGIRATLPKRIDLDDLVAAGNVGLWQAAERFDPDHGAKFTTYAGQRIAGAMKDWMRETEFVSPRVRMERESRGEHVPHVRQFARDPDALDDWEAANVRRPAMGEREPTFEDRETFAATVQGLPRDQRAVLTMIYRDGCTLAETGKAIGFHESRAHQVREVALKSLRAQMTP